MNNHQKLPFDMYYTVYCILYIIEHPATYVGLWPVVGQANRFVTVLTPHAHTSPPHRAARRPNLKFM